jgi:hypothetical protein
MDWTAIKEAAFEDTLKRDTTYMDAKNDVRDERNEFGKQLDELKEQAGKGTIGYGVAGGIISPVVYGLIQYLRGKKITPMGVTGSSIAGYLAGSAGKSYYNQTRPEYRSRYNTAATGYNNRDQLLRVLELKHQEEKANDLLKDKGWTPVTHSEVNLVEKIARDVSGRYDEMLKKNADFLKKQRLAKLTIEVFAPDGKPGIMHGTQWKEEK